MEYRQLITENQRLAVLRFLKDDSDYTLNTSILQDGLTAIGLDISRDKLETEVNWLKEQGLVEIEHILDVSARLIVNRTAFKTRTTELTLWLDKFKGAINDIKD